MKMTTYILLIMITISFAQYNLVWQVDQDYYESGHILFDVNDDDVVDLTKQYGPYITVYDGSDNYSIIWSLNNLDFEYNTLYQELDINTDGSSEFIVVSSDIWTQNRFQVHLYQNLDTEPMWSSPIFEGYLSGTDSFDLLGDGNKNILIGSVNSTDSDYSSSIVLLNGSTGEILWNEPDIDGYITGPYSGDLDGDGKTEILYNQYHQTSETYQLISSEISIEWCGSGDINEDTMLDILDIVALVTCIMDGCNFEDFPCCDITNDQSIDILDIVLMIDRILGEWFYQNLTIIEEWQVDQNQYESGHLSFDINLDGYPELTKTLFNTVTIYNAVNNYQVDWSFLDEESDYLSLQIFDQEGKFLMTWRQFGRPSGVYIDHNDILYVADSESNSGGTRNPGFDRGIRIGSAITGWVTAFIRDPDKGTAFSRAEGVTADEDGNIYGAEVEEQNMRKYVARGTLPRRR